MDDNTWMKNCMDENARVAPAPRGRNTHVYNHTRINEIHCNLYYCASCVSCVSIPVRNFCMHCAIVSHVSIAQAALWVSNNGLSCPVLFRLKARLKPGVVGTAFLFSMRVVFFILLIFVCAQFFCMHCVSCFLLEPERKHLCLWMNGNFIFASETTIEDCRDSRREF